MKRLAFVVKTGIITFIIIAAVSLALLILTRANFLGDLVVTQIVNAVRNELNVELEMSRLTGNPIIGFKGKGLSFVRSGEKLFTIDRIAMNLSLMSIIKNSPRLSTVVLDGLNSDLDSILKIVPESKEGLRAKDIPIDKIKLNNVKVTSKWGLLELNDSSLELRGLEWFAPALKGKFKNIPFSIHGIAKKESGNWIFNGFSTKLDEGFVKISGIVYPVPDFKAEVKDLNIDTAALVFPNILKYDVMGILSANIEMKGSGKEMAMSGDGVLKKAAWRKIPLEEVAAKWNYDKGILEIVLDEGKVRDSSLSGVIKLDTRTPAKYIELNASAKKLHLADWTDKITHDASGNIQRLKGTITGLEANLKGPLNALVGEINVAPSNVTYDKMKFTEFKGKILFTGKPSGDVDFTALNEGTDIKIKGTVSAFDGINIDLKLNAKSIKLDQLSDAVVGFDKYAFKGAADISAVVEGVLDDLKIKADISSPSLEMGGVGKLAGLRLSADYHVSEGLLSLKKTSVNWNGARITASGNMKTVDDKKTLSLNGDFRNASLKNFHETLKFLKSMGIYGDASGSWSVKGVANSPKVLLKMSAVNGRFNGLQVDKFYTEMTYSSGKLDFTKMQARGAGGSADLKSKVFLPVKAQEGKSSSPLRWEVGGKIKNVDLSALNILFKADQDLEGPFSGELKIANDGQGLKWKADISTGSVRWREVRAEKVEASLNGDPKVIRIENASMKFLRGKHLIKGNITPAPEGKPFSDASLNLTISSENINTYELLRKHLPVVRGVQGLIKSEIKVLGTLGNPLYKGGGTLAPFRYRGFLLPMVDVKFDGSFTDVNISEAKARLDKGEFSAKGRVFMKDGKWYGALDTNGKGIDLKQIGVYLPTQFRERLGGNVNFKFSGKGEVANFGGEGSFSSERMRFLGIRIKNVNAPFYITEGYAVMEDVKAETNGGTVSGGLAMDINESKWGGNLTVLSADVEPMLKQSFPGLKGALTGKGDLKIRAEGEMGRMSTVKAIGVLFLKDGEISGFEAVEAAKKYTKGKPLLYKSLHTAFTYDEGYLTILPGSQAIAPPGDPVYRYVMLDGLISNKREVSLFTMGKVNLRALNALLGALQGVINVGMDFAGELDTSALLQNFLGGILSGYARTDFRFVTLNINGTIDSPVFNNVKVDKSGHMRNAGSIIPKSASDPNEKDYSGRDTVFRLKFELPCGPGINYTEESFESQILEQTLGNILQGITFGN